MEPTALDARCPEPTAWHAKTWGKPHTLSKKQVKESAIPTFFTFVPFDTRKNVGKTTLEEQKSPKIEKKTHTSSFSSLFSSPASFKKQFQVLIPGPEDLKASV